MNSIKKEIIDELEKIKKAKLLDNPKYQKELRKLETFKKQHRQNRTIKRQEARVRRAMESK